MRGLKGLYLHETAETYFTAAVLAALLPTLAVTVDVPAALGAVSTMVATPLALVNEPEADNVPKVRVQVTATPAPTFWPQALRTVAEKVVFPVPLAGWPVVEAGVSTVTRADALSTT